MARAIVGVSIYDISQCFVGYGTMQIVPRKSSYFTPRLPSEAFSLTGLLVIVTAVTAAASWCFGDPVIVVTAAYLLAWAVLIVWAFLPKPPLAWPPQWSLRRMFVVVSSLAVLAATFAHQAPFRLRFALSRSSLERLADKIEQGKSVALPQRSGLFIVYATDSLYKRRLVRLRIDRSLTEFTGFVRRRDTRLPGYQARVWYSMMLDDCWQYLEED